MTQAPLLQTREAPVAVGHMDGSQSVGSQPYLGSSMATQSPPQSF